MTAARNAALAWLAGVAMFVGPDVAWRMLVVGGALLLVACLTWAVATGRSW